MNSRRFALIPILFVALGANAQERTADPLGPMTQCVNRDGFHYERKDRRPVAATTREIDTKAGPLKVSTVDGYRLMVHRKSSSPLVNLKLERSAEGQFAADRAAIMTQLKEMAGNTKAPYQIELETSTLNGIEVLALNRPTIENASGVISIYTLLDAGSSTVATAYVLNQRPELREFATDAEYAALRDRFIALLSECMGASHKQ
jgi:hypothetical protein